MDILRLKKKKFDSEGNVIELAAGDGVFVDVVRAANLWSVKKKCVTNYWDLCFIKNMGYRFPNMTVLCVDKISQMN